MWLGNAGMCIAVIVYRSIAEANRVYSRKLHDYHEAIQPLGTIDFHRFIQACTPVAKLTLISQLLLHVVFSFLHPAPARAAAMQIISL
jgi:hypothetical protein